MELVKNRKSIDYGGSCKTPVGAKFVLFEQNLHFAQIAYSESNMSICAKCMSAQNSPNLTSKASFATSYMERKIAKGPYHVNCLYGHSRLMIQVLLNSGKLPKLQIVCLVKKQKRKNKKQSKMANSRLSMCL